MGTTITREAPDSPDAVALITELDEVLSPLYPSESRHGLSVERLIAEGVPFFVVRSDGLPAGCGGVKLVGTEYAELEYGELPYAELKRMYVRPQFRGQGLAKQLVEHLEGFARASGVTLLRLETGVHQTEAIGLYERMGFYRIPPFGPYWDDPVSLCYEKRIA
jgi:putative acetyltransferase